MTKLINTYYTEGSCNIFQLLILANVNESYDKLWYYCVTIPGGVTRTVCFIFANSTWGGLFDHDQLGSKANSRGQLSLLRLQHRRAPQPDVMGFTLRGIKQHSWKQSLTFFYLQVWLKTPLLIFTEASTTTWLLLNTHSYCTITSRGQTLWP